MMKHGGNDQIKEFFRKLDLDTKTIPISTLYNSKAAGFYRQCIKDRSQKAANIKTPCEIVESKNKTSRSSSPTNFVNKRITVQFIDGSLGLTLTKSYDGHAIVTRLVSEGQSTNNGVCLNDKIIRVAGMFMDDYEDILEAIPLLSRPLSITFERKVSESIEVLEQ